MKFIYLTKNKRTIVDDEDYEYLNQFKWLYLRGERGGCAARAVSIKKGVQKFIRLHRLLKKCPKEMVVDHINHDPLDNRKKNLRICTRVENNRNKRSFVGASGFKGVAKPLPGRNKWRAFIQGKLIGYFESPKDAAKAYNIKAKKLFGEFAFLNKL